MTKLMRRCDVTVVLDCDELFTGGGDGRFVIRFVLDFWTEERGRFWG